MGGKKQKHAPHLHIIPSHGKPCLERWRTLDLENMRKLTEGEVPVEKESMM